MADPKWLDWGRELQTIAQNGLAYSRNPFDVERFEQIQKIAVAILASYTQVDEAPLADLFSQQAGYATPKVDVRGGVIRDNQILLVRELLDQGRWTLPGGWADVTDTPAEAVIREIREESGYEAKPFHLAAVYDRRRHGHPPFYFSIYKLFFLCEMTGGAPTTSLETGGAEFFSEDRLPELSIGRVTPDEIHMLFRHFRDPHLPTEFD
jgi:ADP-ribose pyrophosphatase YjhB (NUDIX family)